MKALARMRRLAASGGVTTLMAPCTKPNAPMRWKEIAGEVVAAGPQRLPWRIELRLRLDEGAGRRRHATANGEPHPLRLLDNAVALDPRAGTANSACGEIPPQAVSHAN